MLHGKKAKAELFQWTKGRETDTLERLRYATACNVCTWHQYQAGGGSFYVTISEPDADSLVLRFADHDNTSAQYGAPDFNFINRTPTEEEFEEIVDQIQRASLCRMTAFAKHVGLTVPKLKALLSTRCFQDVCENEAYPNTYTKYVVVAFALEILEAAGVNERNPVQQELYTIEDYGGD